MPRHYAIETAYARNVADPLVLSLDGETFHIDPVVDVGRLAVLFARFQENLSDIGDENAPLAERMTMLAEKRVEGIEALRVCLVEGDRERWAEMAPERLDLTSLAGVITWLLSEVGGQATPTPPAPSSNGSSEVGPSSTAGAPPEGSTP